MDSNQPSPQPHDMNIYMNTAGQLYRAATPKNTSDSRVVNPSRGMIYLMEQAGSGYVDADELQLTISTFGNSDPTKYPGYTDPIPTEGTEEETPAPSQPDTTNETTNG